MRAQQRTSALRRIGPNPFGVQFPSVDWQSVTPGGFIVTLDILEAGTFNPAVNDGWTLNGIPQMLNSNGNEMPSSAIIDGNQLKLVYPTGLPPSFNLSLPANDPAFRTFAGGFLSSKLLQVDPVPPVPTDYVVTGGAVFGLGCQLTFANPIGALYMHSLPGFENVTNAEVATLVFSNANNVEAYFPTPCAPGDTIRWVYNPGYFWHTDGGGLAGFVQMI